MATTENKITEAMILDMIAEKCADDEVIVEYCAKKQASLANKAAKAKERNAAKRAAGDELRERVAAVLTSEPQTRDEVFANFAGEEDLSVQKIGARLTQLVGAGLAVKSEVTVDGKKKAAYALASDAE